MNSNKLSLKKLKLLFARLPIEQLLTFIMLDNEVGKHVVQWHTIS
jgi:hypothetical protein